MVYIQQAMNSPLERPKRCPPHYGVAQRPQALQAHPLVIPIRENMLDNLPEPEFQL